MKKTFLYCARKYLGYKQSEIAIICSMTRQRYAEIENGGTYTTRYYELQHIFHMLKILERKISPWSWNYDYPKNFNINTIRNCHLEDLLKLVEI